MPLIRRWQRGGALALPVLLALLTGTVAEAEESDGGVAGEPNPVAANPDRPAESSHGDHPSRRIDGSWNEYDLGVLTFKWGINMLVDWGTAFQSAEAHDQLDVKSDMKVRDFRFSFSGKLKTERKITYSMGLMYDGPTNTWLPRETGVQVGIPELWGNVFVGRQKEGLSLNKVTVGYAVWLMERSPITDATIPVMNDGIKWLGGLPNQRANWNLAYFKNFLPRNPATGWYDQTIALRFNVLPLLPESEGALLHLGVGYHYATYSDGEAQLRSKPESSTAPYFIDTGVFPARDNHLVGAEAYFRKGPWTLGTEYFVNKVNSPETNDPLFHGGEVFASYFLTGEVRPYIDTGGKFGFVEPLHSAFEKGPGAFELVLHASYTDLDSGTVRGGKFWKLTPHLNWYLDSLVRLEVSYGLGSLDRFGTTALHHFLQSRLMVSIQ